jgi:3-methyladenine DNA glycosylase AlkD
VTPAIGNFDVMDVAPSKFVARVIDALTDVAQPTQSEPMRAYMKNDFVFLGVPAPERRRALRGVLGEFELSRRSVMSIDWLTEVAGTLALGPFREVQYVAGDVLEVFTHSIDPSLLTTVVEPMLATPDATLGPWWDLVDHLVGCLISPLGARFDISSTMRTWLTGSAAPIHQRAYGPFDVDLARVRAAVLHQLGRKATTDEALLFEFCAARAVDREFFVAKAIGWALRDHSYVAPESVARFVREHPELTPLATREAMKAIIRRSGHALRPI